MTNYSPVNVLARLGVLVVVAASGIAGCTERTMPTTPSPPPVVPNPAPQPPIPVLGATTFVGFGDSITEGKIHAQVFALTTGAPESYTFKLQMLLSERYTSQTFTVWNAGFGGEHAAEALPRLRSVLAEAHPQVLILMEGANDLTDLADQGANTSSVSVVVDAIQRLVQAAKPQVSTVILGTIPPERADGLRGHGARYVAPFNEALKQMASGEQVPIADVYTQFDPSLQGPDGLHPSDAGYTRIAQTFFDTIKMLLEVPALTAPQTNGIITTR